PSLGLRPRLDLGWLDTARQVNTGDLGVPSSLSKSSRRPTRRKSGRDARAPLLRSVKPIQAGAHLAGVRSVGGEFEITLVLLAGALRVSGGFERHGERVVAGGIVGSQADGLLAFPEGPGRVFPGLKDLCQRQMGVGVPRAQPQVLLIVADGLIELAFLTQGAREREARHREFGLAAQGLAEFVDSIFELALAEQRLCQGEVR